MKTYNIGILGVSNVALRRFIPAIIKTKNINIKFIASRSIEKARKAADLINCDYGNYNQLFENSDNLDIVYISTPPSKRYKYYIKAIKKKLHVFAEKPSFISQYDARKIISLSNSAKIFFFECWMFKYHPQHLMVQKLLDKKIIEEISLFESKFFYPRPDKENIRLKKNLKGGILYDSIGYPINAFCLFFDTNKIKSNYNIIYDKKTKVEKLVNIHISNNNVLANLSAGFDYNYHAYYKIYGTKGEIKLNKCFSIDENHKNTIIIKNNKKIKKIQINSYNQFSLMINNYLNIIEKNKLLKNYNNKMLEYIGLFEKIFKK